MGVVLGGETGMVFSVKTTTTTTTQQQLKCGNLPCSRSGDHDGEVAKPTNCPSFCEVPVPSATSFFVERAVLSLSMQQVPDIQESNLQKGSFRRRVIFMK